MGELEQLPTQWFEVLLIWGLAAGAEGGGAHFLCQLVLTDHRHELGSSPLTIWDVSCDRVGAVGLESLA